MSISRLVTLPSKLLVSTSWSTITLSAFASICFSTCSSRLLILFYKCAASLLYFYICCNNGNCSHFTFVIVATYPYCGLPYIVIFYVGHASILLACPTSASFALDHTVHTSEISFANLSAGCQFIFYWFIEQRGKTIGTGRFSGR